MPKVNWKRRIAGVLGKKPHPYHRHWDFTYTDGGTGYHSFLDNKDLEECAYKSQIKIVRASVLLYIGENDSSVTADLYLPSKVTMVVIHKFGASEAFCFASVGDDGQCSVYAGNKLKKDPYANRME